METIVDGSARLRDPMVILKELSEVYNSLPNDSVDKANIIADLGGKYRGNDLAAFLGNYDLYSKMLNDYKNATGSAAEEAEKTAQSLEGRLNEFSNTWNRTLANIIDSDMLKILVSLGTGMVDLADKTNILQTAMIGFTGFGLYKVFNDLVPLVSQSASSFMKFGDALNSIKSNPAQSYEKIASSIKGLSEAQQAAILTTTKLDKTSMTLILHEAGYSVEMAKSTAATIVDTAAKKSAITATWSLTGAWTALGAAIKANPIGFAITLITTAISALSFLTAKQKQKQDKLAESTRKLKDEFESLGTEIESIKDEIKETNELIDELSSKDNPTIFDNNELTRLKDISGELSIQLDILKEQREIAAKDIAKDANKQFKKSGIGSNPSQDIIDSYMNVGYGDSGAYAKSLVNSDDVYENIAAYKLMTLEIANVSDELDKVKENGEDSFRTEHLENTLNSLKAQSDDVTDKIWNASGGFLEIQDSLQESYDIITKDVAGGILDSEQYANLLPDAQKTYDNYRAISDVISLIYDNIKPLQSDKLKEVREELLQLEKAGKLDIDSVQKYMKYFEHTELTAEQIVDQIRAMAVAQGDLNKEGSDSSGGFDIDNYKEEIDELQSSLSSLSSAQEKLKAGNLTIDELISLMLKFPELIPYVDIAAEGYGNLSEGLTKLSKASTEGLVDDLASIRDTLSDADQIELDTVIDAIKAMGEESLNTSENLKSIPDAIKELNSTHQAIENLNKELKETKTISSSTIESLYNAYPTDLYPELTRQLDLYLVGKANEADVINALRDIYTKDEKSYVDSISSKQKMTADFINELNDKYQVGIKNHASFAEARLKIETELVNTLGSMWSVYYDSATGALLDNDVTDTISKYAPNYYSNLKKMEGQAKAYVSIQSKIDEIASGVSFSTAGLGGSSSKKSKSKKDTSQTFDWISRKLEVLKQQLDSLKKSASNVFSPFTAQAKALNKAIKNVTSQIGLQEKAYKSYMKKANSVGLSSNLKKLVQKGDFKISIYGESTAKKINEYKQWYDEAQKVKQTISDLKQEEKELLSQRIDKISERYDTRIDSRNSTVSKLQSQIELKESTGKTVKQKDYTKIINQQKKNLKDLQTNYSKVKKEFDSFEKSDKNFKYSSKWYEYKGVLTDLETSMSDTNQEIINLKNNILDLRWKPFDDMLNKLGGIKSELDTVIGLLDDDGFDKAGNPTNKGLARLALNFKGIENSKQNIANAQYAIKQLDKQFKNGLWTLDDYNEKMSELQSIVLSSASDMKSYENAIIDFKQNAIDLETKAMSEYIQQKKDALRAEKDLHDYKKSIEADEKNASILRKKIAALALSDDRKDIAERQKLEKQLRDSEEEMSDKQYEHDLKNKEEAYDKDLEEFEKLQEDKLYKLRNDTDTQKKVISDYLKDVKENNMSVFREINTLSEQYGIDLTGNLTSPWASAKTKAEDYFDYVNGMTSNVKISAKKVDTSPLPKDNTSSSNAKSSSSSSTNNSPTSKPKTPSTDGMVSGLSGNIKRGNTGTKVTAVQKALKALGYNIGSTGVDGKFGANTESATKKFQKDNSIAQDGIVGTNTKKKFKLKGYKRGSKGIKKDELAWTQEEGLELIYKPSQNAMLTPLGKGDKVFDNTMTENLMELGKYSPTELFGKINKFDSDFIKKSSSYGSVDIKAPVNITISGVARDDISKVALDTIKTEAPIIVSKAFMKQMGEKR